MTDGPVSDALLAAATAAGARVVARRAALRWLVLAGEEDWRGADATVTLQRVSGVLFIDLEFALGGDAGRRRGAWWEWAAVGAPATDRLSRFFSVLSITLDEPVVVLAEVDATDAAGVADVELKSVKSGRRGIPRHQSGPWRRDLWLQLALGGAVSAVVAEVAESGRQRRGARLRVLGTPLTIARATLEGEFPALCERLAEALRVRLRWLAATAAAEDGSLKVAIRDGGFALQRLDGSLVGDAMPL